LRRHGERASRATHWGPDMGYRPPLATLWKIGRKEAMKPSGETRTEIVWHLTHILGMQRSGNSPLNPVTWVSGLLMLACLSGHVAANAMAESEAEVLRPRTVGGPLRSVAFSCDGKWLADGAWSADAGKVRLWDLET